MAETPDSPLQLPADRFSTDEKPHRQNNSALEFFGQFIFGSLVPVGGIIIYAGSTAPPGYLVVNGAAINRRAYKELFAIIGTDYGVGDGSTTFNIPAETDIIAAGLANGILLIRTGAF